MVMRPRRTIWLLLHLKNVGEIGSDRDFQIKAHGSMTVIGDIKSSCIPPSIWRLIIRPNVTLPRSIPPRS